MNIQIRANTLQQQILLAKNVTANIIWYSNEIIDADAYIDLLFTPENNIFKNIEHKQVIVSSVITTGNNLPKNFARINAWDTFLEKEKLELVTNNEIEVGNILKQLNYQYILVPDIIGMIAPRNIAMIINEAYFALEDEISSKEQIDTAMKLGTNYPYGPFEWANKIGLQNIADLLNELSKTDERYIPSKLLIKELL